MVGMIDKTGQPRSDKEIQGVTDCVNEIMVKYPLVLPLFTVNACLIHDCLLELKKGGNKMSLYDIALDHQIEWSSFWISDYGRALYHSIRQQISRKRDGTRP